MPRRGHQSQWLPDNHVKNSKQTKRQVVDKMRSWNWVIGQAYYVYYTDTGSDSTVISAGEVEQYRKLHSRSVDRGLSFEFPGHPGFYDNFFQ